MQKHSFLALVLLITISTGCQPNATDRSKAAADNPLQQPSSTLPAVDKPTEPSSREGEVIPDSIPVRLTAGATDSPLAPRYSPPGKGLELKPVEVADSLGVDSLETEVVLGWPIEKQFPIKMLVTRVKPDEAYSKLYIDLVRLNGGSEIRRIPKSRRNDRLSQTKTNEVMRHGGPSRDAFCN